MQLPHLSLLSIDEVGLTDQQMANLINHLSHYLSIKHLILRKNTIGVQAATALANLIRQKKLEVLEKHLFLGVLLPDEEAPPT